MASRFALFTALLLLFTRPVAVSQAPTDAERLFASAEAKADAEGDPRAAIGLFEQVLAARGTTRRLSARALVRIGESYEKLRLPTDARAAYLRVTKEFGDITDAVGTARSRLAALSTAPQSTSPFPERTLDRRLYDDRAQPRAAPLSVSPDGKSIVLGKRAGSDPQPAFSIVMRDIESGGERVVAETGKLAPWQVQLSPDGRWLAARLVERSDTNPSSGREDLMVIDLAGAGNAGKPIVLPWSSRSDLFTRVNAGGWLRLQWSPDSRWLPHLQPATTPGRFEVHLFSVATRESRSLGVQIEGIPDFVWSSKGDELAVHVTDRAANVDEIQIVNVAEGTRRSIASPSAADRRTILSGWTASGDLVLRQFRSEATGAVARPTSGEPVELVLLSPGGSARTVCTSPWMPQVLPWATPFAGTADVCVDVTPDGTSALLWSHQSQRVMLRDAKTLTDRPLTTGSGVEQFAHLAPDGRRVLITSNRNGSWAWHVALIGATPDPNPAMLAPTVVLADTAELYWTRDSVVALWSESFSDIYRVGVAPDTGRSTGPLERLTQETGPAYTPAISPDSARIAYWTSSMGRFAIATMDADGANERVVTTDPMQPFRWPYWRSRSEIVFAQRLWNVGGELPKPGAVLRRWYSLSLPTRAMNLLPAAPLETDFVFERVDEPVAFLAPSGELVYGVVNPVQSKAPTSTTRDVHTLRARSIADGTERVVATIDAPSTTLLGILASPDGKQIAYLLRVDTPKGSFEGELGVVSLANSDRRTLLKFSIPTSPFIHSPKAWSPDGKFLLYSHNAQPRVINVATLEHWRLVEDAHQPETNSALARSLQQWGPGGEASWSPDGSFIVLTMSSGASHARQWTNVSLAALERRRR